MSNVMIDAEVMTSIADAIRDKTKTSDNYLPSEMADAIKSISGGGKWVSITNDNRGDRLSVIEGIYIQTSGYGTASRQPFVADSSDQIIRLDLSDYAGKQMVLVMYDGNRARAVDLGEDYKGIDTYNNSISLLETASVSPSTNKPAIQQIFSPPTGIIYLYLSTSIKSENVKFDILIKEGDNE